jgi:hypothetical protein
MSDNTLLSPRPFFDLPYDVRATIYEQIDDDALTPLSKGTEYAGFVLSSSQGKDEIEYIAAQRYGKFLEGFRETFKKKTGHAANLQVVTKRSLATHSLTVELLYHVSSLFNTSVVFPAPLLCLLRATLAFAKSSVLLKALEIRICDSSSEVPGVLRSARVSWISSDKVTCRYMSI